MAALGQPRIQSTSEATFDLSTHATAHGAELSVPGAVVAMSRKLLHMASLRRGDMAEGLYKLMSLEEFQEALSEADQASKSFEKG